MCPTGSFPTTARFPRSTDDRALGRAASIGQRCLRQPCKAVAASGLGEPRSGGEEPQCAPRRGRRRGGHVGGAGGRGPGGRLGELCAPGRKSSRGGAQRTHLGGKLALGAVRGPRRGSRAIGSGSLPSVRLATCHSAAALSAPTDGAVVPQRPRGSGVKNGFACTLSQAHCVAT